MRVGRLSLVLAFLALCGVSVGAPPADGYPNPLSDRFSSAIVCMKRLPDGATVCVRRKTVTALNNGDVYIEEADRSSGIKVNCSGYYPPAQLQLGNLVSFTGEMGTESGQRIIYARSNLDCDLTAYARIGSLGMSSQALLGLPVDPKQPDPPRITGLLPYGMLIKVWGRIVARELTDDDGSWYLYLDDGYRKWDGTYPGHTGIRVYSDKVPPLGEDYQAAIGVCTTKLYDPTPSGPSGDEFVIPIIRTTNYDDLYLPNYEAVERHYGAASGRVRLIGHSGPGVDVRVYSESESVILHNVTDQWTSFSLSRVAEDGMKVTANTPGYLSDTRDAVSGATDIDFELEASSISAEVGTDKSSIRICSDETATVTAMIRDCEGKSLANRQVKLTTTMGSFAESGTSQAIVSTDATGYARATLSANPDGVGVASIRVETYPDPVASAQTQVTLTGPDIAVSASVQYMTSPGTSVITARLTETGLPIPNAGVVFRTDHGVFLQSGTQVYSTTTNQSGNAQATLSVGSAGCARVVATHTNACSHGAVGWTAVAYKSAAWYGGGVQYSNPAVIDMDGDPNGKREVVVVTSAGNLLVLNSQAAVVWSKIMHPQGSNSVACAPMDADRTGLPCVFLGAENQQKLYAYAHNGAPLAGWPAGSNYRFIRVAAAVADVNRDGTAEVVAGDECCYVFSWNPTGDWRQTGTADSSYLWRNLTGTPSTAIYGSTCAIGDIGAPAGILDVMVGTNHAPEMHGFQGDLWGDYVASPQYLPGWPKPTYGRSGSSPAIGDIDGDGKDDMAVGSDGGSVFLWRSGDMSWQAFPTGGAVVSSPALADLDSDGKLDIVVGSNSGRVFAFNWLGNALPGWAGGIRLNSSGQYAIESSPVVGDVTGNGRVEVVVGCNDGKVYALYADGVSHTENGELVGPVAWIRCCVPPGESSAAVMTAPVLDDVDNDGKLDVLAAGDKGIYLFRFNSVNYVPGPALYPWPTFHANNARTGHYGPLPAPTNASIQGIVSKGGVPVSRAKVYVYHEDGSTVPQPYTVPPQPRDYVYSVGTSDPTELGKGAYCISQLEANKTYKLKIVVTGEPDFWVTGIAATTGALRVDIALP